MADFTNVLQRVEAAVSFNRVQRTICPKSSEYEWYMDWKGLHSAYLQHSKADPFQPLNYPRIEKEQFQWFTGCLLYRIDMRPVNQP